MATYPSPEDWPHANDEQRDRAKRSFAELQRREVPVYHGPLFVDDEEHAAMQSAQDVARRTMVLWAVELRAEGVPLNEVLAIINEQGLSKYVSPNE